MSYSVAIDVLNKITAESSKKDKRKALENVVGILRECEAEQLAVALLKATPALTSDNLFTP